MHGTPLFVTTVSIDQMYKPSIAGQMIETRNNNPENPDIIFYGDTLFQ